MVELSQVFVLVMMSSTPRITKDLTVTKRSHANGSHDIKLESRKMKPGIEISKLQVETSEKFWIFLNFFNLFSDTSLLARHFDLGFVRA